MNRAPQRRRAEGELGFATVQYVLGVGLSFVLLVVVANLLVDLYARAAVRDALEEGTHAAVPMDTRPDACQQQAQQVLDGLLHGPVGRGVVVHCRSTATTIAADANVRLRSWLPGLLPDWTFIVHASAERDR